MYGYSMRAGVAWRRDERAGPEETTSKFLEPQDDAWPHEAMTAVWPDGHKAQIRLFRVGMWRAKQEADNDAAQHEQPEGADALVSDEMKDDKSTHVCKKPAGRIPRHELWSSGDGTIVVRSKKDRTKLCVVKHHKRQVLQAS